MAGKSLFLSYTVVSHIQLFIHGLIFNWVIPHSAINSIKNYTDVYVHYSSITHTDTTQNIQGQDQAYFILRADTTTVAE